MPSSDLRECISLVWWILLLSTFWCSTGSDLHCPSNFCSIPSRALTSSFYSPLLQLLGYLASLARVSAFSFPSISSWAGIHDIHTVALFPYLLQKLPCFVQPAYVVSLWSLLHFGDVAVSADVATVPDCNTGTVAGLNTWIKQCTTYS